MSDQQPDPEIGMDTGNLYQEDSFTDRRVGTIQRLTPITLSGDRDDSREIVFVGQTQIMTPGGALPLNFEVPAQSLEDAVGQFGQCAQDALQSTMQKLEEMRREQASSLIVPGSGGPPSGGGGGIQMP